MTHRSLALVFLASLWFAQPGFAQDELAPSSSGSVDNEMPPGDPPKVKKEEGPIVEPIPEGSIKDVSEKRRPYTISALGYMGYWYGLSGGLRLSGEIPIMHNGFIPKINDSFSLEPSFAFAYGNYAHSAVYGDFSVVRLIPAVSAMWSFYFKTNFRAYAALSLGYTIVTGQDSNVSGNYGYFYHDFAVGIFYDFAKHWALRADVGYTGIHAGLAFLI